MRSLVRIACCTAAICLLVAPGHARALLSYAVAAHDDPGSSTGAGAVALGVPDYRFVNDAGLGFGGDDADVFAPGESTVLVFPVPLRNIPGQPDLIVSAYVGGVGETDDAQVEVEVSSNGTTFTPVGSFHTADGRDPLHYAPAEADFASVKQFAIEFGSADLVTQVRLRNAGGTAEGLRLDAVEGLHPATAARYAFEIRLEEYRDPLAVGRFLVRLKNLARQDGEPIRALRIVKPADPILFQNTFPSLFAQFLGPQPPRLLCVENCVPDNAPSPIPYSRHVWSLDGSTEAPPGTGLDPGRQAAHQRSENFDTDFDPAFLQGFSFEVAFADDTVQSFGFAEDVLADGETGALYQKYGYFSSTPTLSGPEPAYFYEFVPEPACGPAALAAAVAVLLLRARSASHRPKSKRPFPA